MDAGWQSRVTFSLRQEGCQGSEVTYHRGVAYVPRFKHKEEVADFFKAFPHVYRAAVTAASLSGSHWAQM